MSSRAVTRRKAVAEFFSRLQLRPAIALPLILAFEGAIVSVDIAQGEEALAATYMLGPFFAAIVSRTWVTAIAAALAVGLAAGSTAWNPDASETDQALRIAAVILGGAFAIFAAWLRNRTIRSTDRLSILAGIAEIADGTSPLEVTVDRFCRRLVPELGDAAILDVVVDGELRRLAVAAVGPRAQWLEGKLAARTPSGADAPTGSARAIRHGEPQLIERVDDAMRREMANDEGDLRVLREIEALSVIVVPLAARGRELGALTILTADSGRELRAEDFRFIQVVGGRAALALDNAGLFRELSSVERQLEAVLHDLADAVTVQSVDGKLVYANQAAAEMLGARSTEELVATPPEELVGRFESYTEEGKPLEASDLPGRKVMDGEEAEPLLVRAIERHTGEERWRLVKASAVSRPGGEEPELVVNVMEDVTDVKRSEVYQRLLADASDLLSSSLDYKATLRRVAEMAVPEFADWCSVNAPRPGGVLEQVAIAHADPARIAFAHELSERYPSRVEDSPAGQVLRTGESQLVSEIPDELLRERAQDDEHYELIHGMGLRSGAIVPVRGAGETTGVMTFATSDSGRTFDEADLAVAEELGRRAAIAIENSREYEQRSAVARTLEAALVPSDLPEVPGWNLAALYEPAEEGSEVGGDFYDAFEIPGGWMVVIGDVCGRGVEAAAMTALARYTLRTAGSLTGDMVAALTQLNDWLMERGEQGICTVAALVLRETGEVQLASAGHPPPVLLRGGEVTPLEEHGPILGLTDRPHWPLQRVQLEPGDQIVLYTDGVTEFDGGEERFGEERLRASLAGAASPAEVLERVRSAHREFSGNVNEDDVAMLGVMWEGSPVATGEAERRRAGAVPGA